MRKLPSLEDNANILLISLALSDLVFCCFAFVSQIAKDIPYHVKEHDVGYLYYQYLGIATINLCLMTSTYIVVILAVDRYIAMYYPLKAKMFARQCSTMWVIVIVFIVCVCATLPYFINNVVVPCYSVTGEEVLYELIPRWRNDYALTLYMTRIWPGLAVFAPLFVLFICNLRLVQGLRKIMTRGSQKHQVTLTLIIIVFMSVILVIPAEIIKLINPYQTWGDKGYIVAEICNAMQAANFATNFFLYCMIDRDFRKICHTIFCCQCEHYARRQNVSNNHIPLVKIRDRTNSIIKVETFQND